MKRCRNCNSTANDSDNFCSACGSSMLYYEQNDTEEQPTQFLAYGRNVRGDRIQMVHNFDGESQYQPKPKEQKTKNLIGIFFAGLLLLFALGTTISIINDKIDRNQNDDYSVSEQTVLYTNGSVSDGVYTNEWADIRIELTDGWEQGSNEDYAEMEDDYIDCGFYGRNGVNTLTVLFVQTGDTTEEDEEDYLKEYALAIGGAMSDYRITEPSFKFVGDYSYLYSKITGNVEVSDMIVSAYLRGLDDRVILITVTGTDIEAIDGIVSSIQAVS